MKYRKLPVEIEAFEWTGDHTQEEDPAWCIDKIKEGKIWFTKSGTPEVAMIIETLEGSMQANQGDYIIRGVKGEIYPCKPDIFEMTYERVENGQ